MRNNPHGIWRLVDVQGVIAFSPFPCFLELGSVPRRIKWPSLCRQAEEAPGPLTDLQGLEKPTSPGMVTPVENMAPFPHLSEARAPLNGSCEPSDRNSRAVN